MLKDNCVNHTISVLYRLSHIYFDRCLKPYHIGSGQQFFLLRIYDHPGISLWQLAKYGLYDKGTTTRAVRKLEESGYIYRKVDDEDKRIHQLYISDEGLALIPIIKKTLQDWDAITDTGLSGEEHENLVMLVNKMAFNATQVVGKCRKKEIHDNDEF